jgi:PhoH-like ATPase
MVRRTSAVKGRSPNGKEGNGKSRIISIIDTNVFLSTGDEVFGRLKNRDVVIPLTVYKELEKYRTDPGGRGYAARAVIRRLEDLRINNAGKDMSKVGIRIANGNTIRVEVNHTDQSVLLPDLRDESSADNKILAVVKNLENNGEKTVEFITNDAPLRFIANVFEHVNAIPYEDGKNEKFTGVLTVDCNDARWSDLHLQIGEIEDEEFEKIIDRFELRRRPYHVLLHVIQDGNEDWIMKSGDKYTEFNEKNWPKAGPVFALNQEQAIANTWLNDDKIQMVSLGGVAGAGKSLLAISYGLDAVAKGKFSKITVFRSMYAVGRQEQGFLKGSADEKMRPWAQAVWDNVRKYDKLKGRSKSRSASEKTLRSARADDDSTVSTPDGKTVPLIEAKYGDEITVEPITYLRGRTLEDQLIIVDDAQSLDRSILLDVVSRLGHGSKIIFTFDMDQQDNPYLSSGTSIESLVNRLKSEKVFAHIDFTKSERSELAQLASKLLSELN